MPPRGEIMGFEPPILGDKNPGQLMSTNLSEMKCEVTVKIREIMLKMNINLSNVTYYCF